MNRTLTAITVVFAIAFSVPASAQIRNNALSLEIGKTGLIYNLNYDHKPANKSFGFRATIGSNLAKYIEAFNGGIGAYYLMGNHNNYFEIGTDIYYLSVYEASDDQRGFSPVYPDYTISTYHVSLNLGYRRYGRRTLFRFGVSPGITKEGFIPGGYISYGFRF